MSYPLFVFISVSEFLWTNVTRKDNNGENKATGTQSFV